MKCFENDIKTLVFLITCPFAASGEFTCNPDVNSSPGSWCLPHKAEKLRKMDLFVLWSQITMGIITFNMPFISNVVAILKYIYTSRPVKNMHLRKASHTLPHIWEWTVANLQYLMSLPYWKSAVKFCDFWSTVCMGSLL